MNTTHELKIEPKYFDAIFSGRKTFEIRKNDRNFNINDILILKEFFDGEFTGNYIKVKVIYLLENFEGISNGYIAIGFVVMSFKFFKKHKV